MLSISMPFPVIAMIGIFLVWDIVWPVDLSVVLCQSPLPLPFIVFPVLLSAATLRFGHLMYANPVSVHHVIHLCLCLCFFSWCSCAACTFPAMFMLFPCCFLQLCALLVCILCCFSHPALILDSSHVFLILLAHHLTFFSAAFPALFWWFSHAPHAVSMLVCMSLTPYWCNPP